MNEYERLRQAFEDAIKRAENNTELMKQMARQEQALNEGMASVLELGKSIKKESKRWTLFSIFKK